MPAAPPTLQSRALKLLSLREHSRLELERKLQRHGPDPQELARVLDHLQSKGLIDARRAAESVLHRRASVHGVGRIRQELREKGLDPALAESLRHTELPRARAIWERRYGAQPRPDLSTDAGKLERARQMRFLAARGFGGDTIRRVLGGSVDSDE